MLLTYLLALFGGFCLFISQPPRNRPELQFLSLALFGWAVEHGSSPWQQATTGICFGVAYIAPTLYQLQLLPLISAALGIIQTLEWSLLALGVSRLLYWHPFFGAFAGAALATAIAWLDVKLLPIWGTAQSWARPWSHRPRLVQFVCVTGWSGSIFFVTATAFLITNAFQAPSPVLPLAIAVMTQAFLTTVNEALWWSQRTKTLRVATLGWNANEFSPTEWALVVAQSALENAVEQGARLIVTPETAFVPERVESWRKAICATALNHNVNLALGYMDSERQENCIDFVTQHGELAGRYLKTHLVPIFETYNAGQGKRTVVDFDDTRTGGVICQDDNFTEITRGYGRDGIELLTVPTHDWPHVKDFHLTSTRWRALEGRYAIARAACNGISTLLSARGEMLEQSDHCIKGFQMLIANVPVGTGRPTLYARYGDWFPVLCLVFSAVCLVIGG